MTILFPNQMVVVLFLMACRVCGTAGVVTIFGGQQTDTQSTIDSPMTTKAVLIAYINISIQMLALISVTAFPFNVVITQANSQSDVLMHFPEGSTVMNPHTPYCELSFGIHNILNLLRIEYIRRLNYLDLPTSNKQALKFSVAFKF